MDTHLMPLHLSHACASHLHAGCPETGCGCGCHKRCSHCGREREATFNVSQVIGSECLVCGKCYIAEVASRWHKRCEDCGSTEAFCENSVGAVYLCLSCHRRRDLRHAPRLAS